MDDFDVKIKESVHGYKGFESGLICRDKQYAENTTYTEPKAELCQSGMHFCKNPLNVLNYYKPYSLHGEVAEFAKVEALGNVIEGDDKCCTDKLRVGEKLDLSQFVDESVEYLSTKALFTREDEDIRIITDELPNTISFSSRAFTAINSGYNGVSHTTRASSTSISRGYYSAAVNEGYDSLAIAMLGSSVSSNKGFSSISATMKQDSIASNDGDESAALNMGIQGAAINSGNGGASVSLGFMSAAVSKGKGDVSLATGEKSSAIAEGKHDVAISTGNFSTSRVNNKNSIAIATGFESFASGALGDWIVLAEWNENKDELLDVKAHKVDGIEIKPDTLYALKNGEFVGLNVVLKEVKSAVI